MELNQDQAFVEFVVKSLVKDVEAVRVERTVDEMGVLLQIHVAQPDMSVLIGRSGEHAKAIRTLVRVVGMKSNARVNVRIVEPEGSTYQPKFKRESSGTFTGPAKRSVDEVMDELH